MTESNDVQALEKITTEIDESQLKIILSIQCIKAQGFLVNKLQKQSEHQKQICKFISNGNLKLETEIKLAEHEVKSLLIALDSINLANVELQKELLLAKERKTATAERVNNGIKKYEQLWLTSKKRYENIPFIHNYLQIINKKDVLQDNIKKLIDEKQKLLSGITAKNCYLLSLDRQNILELAKYMVHERPIRLQQIQNKQEELNGLIKEIEALSNPNETKQILKTALKNNSNVSKTVNSKEEDSWLSISKTFDNETVTLPKLQLRNIDLDIFSHKLDKLKQVDSQNVCMKRVDSEPLVSQIKRTKTDSDENIYISSYFQTQRDESADLKSNYSEKKLIHILEDVKLDKAAAFDIVSKVNCSELQNVDSIGEVPKEKLHMSQDKEINKSIEDVEEVDLTNKQNSDVLIPPTQFLDMTQEVFMESQQIQVSLENNAKDNNNKNCSQEKRVTFSGIVSVTNSEMVDFPETDNQLDTSATSNDSYKKIKETIFKKHNLDISPEFTYSKNPATFMNVQCNTVTSKFFNTVHNDENKVQLMEVDYEETSVCENNTKQCVEKNKDVKENKTTESTNEIPAQKEPVAGFLFTHGPQGIPDSLDVSASTLGYDDADFAPCIDSSLLLSPKADEEVSTTSENVNVLSQDVPNFLSGLRKTGLSFFGSTSEEILPNNSVQNKSGSFSFSFGGDDKKPRGGLFSIFR